MNYFYTFFRPEAIQAISFYLILNFISSLFFIVDIKFFILMNLHIMSFENLLFLIF